jgi:hypothetical protein
MKRLLITAFAVGLFLACKPCHVIENDAYKYAQFTSTTTVSSIPVKLHAITITDSVAVACSVYDSTSSGTTTPVIAVIESAAAAGTYLFDIQTQNGLQFNCAANGPQITVSYR